MDFIERLKLGGPIRLEYHWRSRLGRIYLEPLCCTDMTGAIELFTRIDPKVTRIEVYSGGLFDTIYHCEAGAWVAREPQRAPVPEAGGEYYESMNRRHNICGYCGAPIMLLPERDTADLDKGWDHVAMPCDWGLPEWRPTRWHHREKKRSNRETENWSD
jgi:hypothetical protein